jgi:hypothetical protein
MWLSRVIPLVLAAQVLEIAGTSVMISYDQTANRNIRIVEATKPRGTHLKTQSNTFILERMSL